jgi:U3 small nucleolar RNA-associated protein 3
MGKKRHTAKTGDKGLYKARSAADESTEDRSGVNVDDDPMYNEVDRFHNDKDKDFLLFDQNDDNNSESDDVQEEGVMDLGVVDSDGEDDASSDESDGDQEMVDSDDEGEAAPLSSSDDDEEDEFQENVRDWGRKKSAYYNGDTADLEIGQDKEDAILEEQAAKQVQAARFQNMTEEDFLLSDSDDQADDADENAELQERGLIASRIDVSKLSAKEKGKLLNRKHPEFLPLLSHFSPMVRDFHSKTSIVTKAVFFGEPGTANVRIRFLSQRFGLLCLHP